MTDITTELIEKAAQAVWEDRYPDIPFEDVNEHNVRKLSVYGHARAALAAIWPDVERREAKLKEALAPFAAIKPSTFFADGEDEGYSICLSAGLSRKYDPDFRRSDLERAKEVLNDRS